MKIKIKALALSKADGFEGDEYELYGLEPGGVYDVLSQIHELGVMIINNKYDINVMVYNFEVEHYED